MIKVWHSEISFNKIKMGYSKKHQTEHWYHIFSCVEFNWSKIFLLSARDTYESSGYGIGLHKQNSGNNEFLKYLSRITISPTICVVTAS